MASGQEGTTANNVHFSGPSNRGLQLGQNYSNITIHQHLPPTIDFQATNCIRALKITDPRNDRQDILRHKDALLKDTASWLYEDGSFRAWRDAESSPILWLHGDAGKGKTMIMMAVINHVMAHLKRTGSSQLLVYHFCLASNQKTNTAAATLRALIYFIISERPDLLHWVQKRYDEDGEGAFDAATAVGLLWSILSDLVQDTSLEGLFILVDALDEMTDQDELLCRITHENLRLPSAKVRWLISSRNEDSIRRALELDPSCTSISLETKSDDVAHSVTSYVNLKVEELARAGKYSAELTAHVRRYLVENASGTFLWVALVCKELKRVKRRHVEVELSKFPSGLVPVYDRMLQSLDLLEETEDADVMRALICAAVIAPRPLHVQETLFVANLSEDQVSHVEDVKDAIEETTSFLVLRDECVHFIHQSAKDYFVTGAGRDALFAEGLMRHHASLASRCFDKMQQELSTNICGLQWPGTVVQDLDKRLIHDRISVMLKYACSCWLHHSMFVLKEPRAWAQQGVHERILAFLQLNLLQWLECVSLLGQIPSVLREIVQLKLLLDPTTAGKELHALISDSLHFITEFRAMIELAPLQIYSAGLLFSPNTSLVRSSFTSLIPDWIDRPPLTDDTWAASLHTLEGHTDYVKTVVVSSNGKYVASGSYDKTVRIWDTTTGAVVQILKGHSGPIRDLQFFADNAHLVSVSDDKTAKIWDVKTGELLIDMIGHSKWVMAVDCSSDGKQIVSASYDGDLRLWNSLDGSLIQLMEGHSAGVKSVSYSPDDRFIASGSDDCTVRVWDGMKGIVVSTLNGHVDFVNSVVFSPRSSQILASGSKDGDVRIWDTMSKACLHILDGHTDSVEVVAFQQDASRLVSGSHDTTARIWDISLGDCLFTLDGHSDYIKSACFWPDGSRVATASDDKTVRVWDATTGTPIHVLQQQTGPIRSVVVSADGAQVAFGSHDKSVRIWDPTSGTSLTEIDSHTDFVRAICFSPDGNRIASGSHDGSVRIWSVETAKTLHVLCEHDGWVMCVSFDPDGSRLASGSDDKTVRIWDVEQGILLLTIPHHDDAIYSVNFSSDGKQVVSGCWDSYARVIDVADGSITSILRGHTGRIFCATFSVDGTKVVSGADDMTVRVWDLATDEALYVLRGHNSPIASVNFMENQRLVLAKSDSNHELIWDLTSDGGPYEMSNENPYTLELLFDALELSETERLKLSTGDDGLSIDLHGSWILSGGQKVLWLPTYLRPSRHATYGGTIAMGTRAGRVTFLSLDTKRLMT